MKKQNHTKSGDRRPIFRAFAVALAAVAVLSCSKFLEIEPEAELPTPGFDYTQMDNMFQPVSGTYASLRSNMAHGMAYMAIAGMSSDDDDKGSTPNDSRQSIELDAYTHEATNTYLNEYWKGLYEIVSAANNGLNMLPKFEPYFLTEEDRTENLACQGECRFLRAYAYFCLNRAWGGVPIVEGMLTSLEINSLPRPTADQVWDFIQKDLTFAIQHLPAGPYPKEWAGRVTRYSAMALKAKAFLYQNRLDSVAIWTDSIILQGKYSLYRSFYDLFRIKGENCSESLFEVQSSDLNVADGPTAYVEYGYYQGPRDNTPYNMQGWGFKTPSQALIDFLASRQDTVRQYATLLWRGTMTYEGDSIRSRCANRVYNRKVYCARADNHWAYNGYAFDHNIRILRYADVLLMNAEAKVQIGGDALTPINLVRARAQLDPLTSVDLQAVWDERRAELAMEENRYFDLIRTKRALDVLGPLGFTERNYLMPIPAAQRTLNPNLTQNPGF